MDRRENKYNFLIAILIISYFCLNYAFYHLYNSRIESIIYIVIILFCTVVIRKNKFDKFGEKGAIIGLCGINIMVAFYYLCSFLNEYRFITFFISSLYFIDINTYKRKREDINNDLFGILFGISLLVAFILICYNYGIMDIQEMITNSLINETVVSDILYGIIVSSIMYFASKQREVILNGNRLKPQMILLAVFGIAIFFVLGYSDDLGENILHIIISFITVLVCFIHAYKLLNDNSKRLKIILPLLLFVSSILVYIFYNKQPVLSFYLGLFYVISPIVISLFIRKNSEYDEDIISIITYSILFTLVGTIGLFMIVKYYPYVFTSSREAENFINNDYQRVNSFLNNAIMFGIFVYFSCSYLLLRYRSINHSNEISNK